MYDEIQRCFTGDRLGGLRGGALCMEGVRQLAALGEIGSLHFSDFLDIDIWRPALHILFTHPDRRESIQMTNDYWSFCKGMAGKSPAQIRYESIDIDQEAMKIVKGNILLEILMPAVNKVFEHGYRNRAEVEATVAIVAIIRYEKEKGVYPESLIELVESGYLKEVPIDPFSDEPLVYRRTESGFTLYSVGLDFEDDGGLAEIKTSGRHKGEVILWHSENDSVFWPVPDVLVY